MKLEMTVASLELVESTLVLPYEKWLTLHLRAQRSLLRVFGTDLLGWAVN